MQNKFKDMQRKGAQRTETGIPFQWDIILLKSRNKSPSSLVINILVSFVGPSDLWYDKILLAFVLRALISGLPRLSFTMHFNFALMVVILRHAPCMFRLHKSLDNHGLWTTLVLDVLLLFELDLHPSKLSHLL